MKKQALLIPLYLWTIAFVALPMLYMLGISFESRARHTA